MCLPDVGRYECLGNDKKSGAVRKSHCSRTFLKSDSLFFSVPERLRHVPAEEGVSAEDRQKVPDCAENAGGESAAECAAQKKELPETEKNTPAEDMLFSDEAPPLAGT